LNFGRPSNTFTNGSIKKQITSAGLKKYVTSARQRNYRGHPESIIVRPGAVGNG